MCPVCRTLRLSIPCVIAYCSCENKRVAYIALGCYSQSPGLQPSIRPLQPNIRLLQPKTNTGSPRLQQNPAPKHPGAPSGRPKMDPKMDPKWIPKGSGQAQGRKPRPRPRARARAGPKWVPKWDTKGSQNGSQNIYQNGPHMGPKIGPTLVQKWTKSQVPLGELWRPSWPQDGSKSQHRLQNLVRWSPLDVEVGGQNPPKSVRS